MLSRLDWSICCLSLAVWGIVVFGGHYFVPDDVFFYLRIADSITTGHGSTFNGVTRTNGYHPLWMVVCVLLRTVVSNREGLIRALFVASAALSFGTLVLFADALRRGGIHTRWPALLLMAYYTSTVPAGSEFHISLPLLVLLVDRAIAVGSDAFDTRRLATVGAVAGLSMLARLDNVFFVVAVSAAVLWSRRDRFVLAAALIGTPAVLLVAPYLAWNAATFGAIVPVSGVVKSTFARAGIAKMGRRGVSLALGSATLIVARSRGEHERPGLFSAMVAGAAAHSLYVVFRMSAVWPWYFASELVCASFAASFWAERIARLDHLSVRTARFVPAVSVLLGLGAAFRGRWAQLRESRSQSEDWYIEAAAVVDDVVPLGQVIATIGSPGGLAYYSHRGVFAFDGLTLDYAYHRDAAREGLATYLEHHNITYLFGYAPDSEPARQLGALSQVQGPVECTAYRMSPDKQTVVAYEVYSCVSGASLGKFELAREALERANFCPAPFAIWHLRS